MSDVPDRLTAALEGRYVVEARIGAGGMATVYRAHDLRHDRKVAIKVLRPELAAIMGGERFLSEIRTTANLQHPHILPLFDSGEADGFLFYVMPYVEGETLREKMDREKQLPLDYAIRIGSTVAGALDYAHRNGVIHRDIKPANILVHDDQPVVADFGIALAVQQAGGGRLTETGLSMGTPHYMSPEQATADRDPDARSDIYSLGCVVYELLTGEPPFPGSTAQAVLGKIISAPPTPPTEHRKSIPPHLEAVLLKALEKVPADRFGSAAEFAAALEDPSVGKALLAGSRQGRAVSPGHRILVPILAAASILLAGLATWGWLRDVPGEQLTPARYRIQLNDLSRPVGWIPAIARDGSAIAYVGRTEEGETLFLKERDAAEGVPIRGGPGPYAWVAFSPDGTSLVVHDEASLRIIPRQGGPATIVRSDGGDRPVAWMDDGTILAAADSGVIRISETGAEEEFFPIEGPGSPWMVQTLPGVKGFFLTTRESNGRFHAWIYDLQTRTVRSLADDARHVWFVEPDYVVIPRVVSGGVGLFAGRLDLGTLELDGPLVPLSEPIRDLPDIGSTDMLLSWNGTLVFGAAAEDGDDALGELSWVDRDGTRTPADTAWRFKTPISTGGMRLSPDGTRVAISLTEESGATNIFVKRLPEGPPQKVTFATGVARRPSWRPDGEAILYVTDDGTGESLWEVRTAGIGSPTKLVSEEREIFDGLWSPDGDWIVYRTDDEGAPGRGDILGIRPGSDSDTVPLATGPAEETSPAISPDGRWLAYASTEAGGNKEIFVRPFPNTGDGLRQISDRGGTEPAWSPDGTEIYYWSGDDFKAATVRAQGGFELLGTTTLFTTQFPVFQNQDARWYDVASDGRFLMLTPSTGDPSGRTILVEHFDQVIRQALER